MITTLIDDTGLARSGNSSRDKSSSPRMLAADRGASNEILPPVWLHIQHGVYNSVCWIDIHSGIQGAHVLLYSKLSKISFDPFGNGHTI